MSLIRGGVVLLVCFAGFIALPGPAGASHSPDFSISPAGCAAPCTVTVAETTVYPSGEAPEGTFFEFGPPRRQVEGSTATHTFQLPGTYTITMTAPSNVDGGQVAKTFTVAETPAEPGTKRCAWEHDVCLLGEGPFVSPTWLRFEVPRSVSSLRGIWRDPGSGEIGRLEDPHLVEEGPAEDRETWEALLPPLAADGAVDIQIRTADAAGSERWSDFQRVPVLAPAVGIEATIEQRRRAFVPTFSYTARRDVRTEMISVLFGTKGNGRWRELAQRRLNEQGFGGQIHRQRFRKRLVRRKCRRHGPCRIGFVAILFADDYAVDGFVALERIRTGNPPNNRPGQ